MDQQENVTKTFDFIYTFRPIYYISRASGMMPFSILCDSKGEIQKPRINKCDVLWLIISLCLYLSSAYLFFQNMRLSFDLHTNIMLLGDYILQTAVFIFGISIIWLNMFNRFKLVSIFKRFVVFDKEVCTT